VNRTLVVTNDFPPRPGGIQTFVHGLVSHLPPQSVVVYASRWRGWEEFDAAQPFPVIRDGTGLMLPTPAVTRRARDIARAEGATAVLFGAAAPLGLMAPALRSAGPVRAVALTHGHEAAWAQLPGPRALLRRIGDGVDVVTYLGEYTRRRVGAALSPAAAARMVQLSPAVDTAAFRPGAGADEVRRRLGLADRPVVVCVSRLMPRKGQDVLVRSWPAVRAAVPDALLLLVGGGPYRRTLERLVDERALRASVRFTGSVPAADLPSYYDAGDVFAMPCRTRRRGLDVEGLGIVYLEASATGLPVVAGDSGGAPDAVLEGETGHVVDGRSAAQVAAGVLDLLRDPARAQAMGAAGRAWVTSHWTWPRTTATLTALLT
jgi:phosphatidyl-myo-inositol dimannoside synthase